MKLGKQVGLDPGHIVLDGDPGPPPPTGHSPLPNFWPISVAANGCMDQDVTWYGARPWHRPGDFVLDGDPAPPPQKGASASPNFRPMFIVAKRLDG